MDTNLVADWAIQRKYTFYLLLYLLFCALSCQRVRYSQALQEWCNLL